MRYIFPLLSMCLLSGCANFAPALSKDAKPSANATYVYGSFAMDAKKALLSFAGHQTMGFSIACADQKNYVIKFSVDSPLQLIEIAPSKCRLKEFVYTDADGVVKSRKQVSDALSKDFELLAGKAHYLGDFAAVSTVAVTYPTINYRWEMRDVKDNYSATTEQMRRSFPAFSSLPTENRMLGK